VIISPAQSIRGFCQQRGENDPSHARQGAQDRNVALLIGPLLSVVSNASKAIDQAIEAAIGLGNLLVHELESLDDGLDMGRCRADRAWRYGDSGRTERFENILCQEAPDAVTLQQPLDRRDANPFPRPRVH